MAGGQEGDRLGLSTTWTSLPGTRLELHAIKQAVGLDRVTSYVGRRADKSSLLTLDRPRVLHLATHAFFVVLPTALVVASGDDVPVNAPPELRTGLVLAGANERRGLRDSSPDDGIVTALELTTILDLSATELVVLSACDTAIGDLNFGDSVHGVRRACHTAGAHAVVAGLWPVTDAGSARMMAALYSRLADAAPIGEAVHAATLDMLNAARAAGRVPHPHGWAAFVASGGVEAITRPAFP